MKPRLFLTSVFLAVMNMMNVYAYDFEVDGFRYNILSENEKTVELTYKIGEPYEGDIDIPSSVTYEGQTYNVTGVGNYAFCAMKSDNERQGNTSLNSVNIPNSVTSIGEYAFYRCI